MSEMDLHQTLANLAAELSEVKRQLAETNQRLDSLGAPRPSTTPLPKIDTISAHRDGVSFVAIAPDGQRLISAGKDGTVKTWNLNTGELERTRSKPYSSGKDIKGFAASADSSVIAGCEGRNVWIWDSRTGEQAHILVSEKQGISCVAVSLDGQLLALRTGSQVKVYDVVSGQCQSSLESEHRVHGGIAISADKLLVAVGDFSDGMEMWGIKTGRQISVIPSHKGFRGEVCALAFSPVQESTIFAISTYNKSIKIFDSNTGELLRSLYGHSGSIKSIAISANGKVIASGSSDSTVRAWDLSTGSLIGVLSSHLKAVNYLYLSQDGQLIASGSDDGTVKIWRPDIRVGQ